MELQIWRPGFQWALMEGPWMGTGSPWEYSLVAVYALLAVALLVRRRGDFSSLAQSRVVLLVALAVSSALAGNLLILRIPPSEVLPFPALASESLRLSVPMLGSLPLLAAAVWLGTGPAMLVGLLGGIIRADAATDGLVAPFTLLFLGGGIALLLRQDYRGRLPAIARQPVAAAVVSAPIVMLSLFPSVAARMAPFGLSGLEFAISLTAARALSALIESLAAAVVIQAIYMTVPRVRPVRAPRRSAPQARSLNRQFLRLVVPLVLVTTAVLITAVTATTIRVAREQAIKEMAQDAYTAAEAIPQFIRTGQALLMEFASDERLRQGGAEAVESRLMQDVRMNAFFDQLLLFDQEGQLLAMYPAEPTGDPRLTAEEASLMERVLRDGTFQISRAHRSPRSRALLSFLAPAGEVEGMGEGGLFGALVGRTHLDVNPLMTRILTGLQWTSGLSEGLVIDAQGRVVAHPDSGMLLMDWQTGEDRTCTSEVARGELCVSRDPVRQTLRLTYYLATDGYPWTVVIRLPYTVVLDEARQIAKPLLILQALFGVGLVFGISSVTRRLTQPLERLAVAADRIAGGLLTEPLEVNGEDEVARVGDAFEDMRARLKDRMSDLSLLLEVSRAVSSTLELPRGIPFILEGALEATGGRVARAVFLSAAGDPQFVISAGEHKDAATCAAAEALDDALAQVVKGRRSPFVVEDLTQAKALLADEKALDPDLRNGPIRALIALPVQTGNRTPGVLWVGYGTAERFGDAKLHFLSTLTSQTAVLLENARLFQAVEGERRRLSALLNSISDAVVVTDQENRVLLVNPAAERAFDLKADALLGKQVDQAGLDPELVDALTKPATAGEMLIEQKPLLDGRALYVNVSTILKPNGQQIGRVAVMRDVSRFRQLDQMKSEFLATVSHDLRAPLTYMRGYADRLDAVGELNGKQREYVANIICGIERIDSLVTDLLDLRRIEAGLGLEREPCRLGAIVAEAVQGMKARADDKDINLQMRIPPVLSKGGNGQKGDVTVAGDRALLRQVVVNLLDNAIKYTPSGGTVTVELAVPRDGEGGLARPRAVISVVDSGVGIAPDDQVRLFEKFYRIKSGDGLNVKGTGLGLALVKSIVERHRGKVWVNSRLNKGSTFYISLPLMAGTARASELATEVAQVS